MTGGERAADGTTTMASRSAARLAAVQALYQIDLAAASAEDVIDEFHHFRLREKLDGIERLAADSDLFDMIVRGTQLRRDELDVLIAASLAPGWSVERLETVLRATLRAGAFELIVDAVVPAAVVITEYVDVTHAFFAGKEPGFVNGVLDKLARSLRPGELQEKARG